MNSNPITVFIAKDGTIFWDKFADKDKLAPIPCPFSGKNCTSYCPHNYVFFGFNRTVIGFTCGQKCTFDFEAKIEWEDRKKPKSTMRPYGVKKDEIYEKCRRCKHIDIPMFGNATCKRTNNNHPCKFEEETPEKLKTRNKPLLGSCPGCEYGKIIFDNDGRHVICHYTKGIINNNGITDPISCPKEDNEE
jgi:hypothetical protein